MQTDKKGKGIGGLQPPLCAHFSPLPLTSHASCSCRHTAGGGGDGDRRSEQTHRLLRGTVTWATRISDLGECVRTSGRRHGILT